MFFGKNLPYFFTESTLDAFRQILDEHKIPHRVYYVNSVRNAGVRGIAVDQFAPNNAPKYQITVKRKDYTLADNLAKNFYLKR